MMERDVKKIVYKVVVSNNGFEDFEAKVSEKLNQGWKAIGGIAFNYNFPYQAMAKVIDAPEEKGMQAIAQKLIQPTQEAKPLTANEAMKRLDDLT
jgi:hypothetical protein